MSAVRKVTMNLPAELIDDLPQLSDKTMTEAVRIALTDYRHKLACQNLLELRGKIEFGATWQALVGKYDDE